MRLLHTADWHLGRIFHNVHLTDDQAHVLEQFIALAADAKPDAVIIAGDVYDRSVPPPEAVSLLNDTLSRLLLDCRVPVIIISGNHDSPERLGFGEKIMAKQNLHVVSRFNCEFRPLVITDKYGPVYFCPIPYSEPAVIRAELEDTTIQTHDQAMAALSARSLANIPLNSRRVAIAHAYITGGQDSESERPLSIGGIATVNADILASFNYAALGHLHQPQQVGSAHIRYSGSLLKYSFAESNQKKSVSLVEIDEAGNAAIEPITLSPRRDVRCLEGFFDDIILNAANDASRNDYIMVRFKDHGAIFDPFNKLRQVYPNILQLERILQTPEGSFSEKREDHRRKSEADLFTSFFGQVTGQPPSEQEINTLHSLLNDFNRREREA